MTYDTIIIGGGLGGLTAGAKLAKEGRSVLLLEQRDRPGGCATTFKRKKYIMEVGLHEMDGLHPADGKTKIFNDLGLFDDLTFIPVPEFFRFKNDNFDLVIPHYKHDAISLLKEYFPDQADGIDAYFERLTNAKRNNILERNNPDISVGDFLDSLFSNDDIKLILLGNLCYFHDDPYSLSLKYFSIAEGSYFQGRANYIQGGSQKLSDRLVGIIRENGGKVLLNHRVNTIIINDGKVSGITFKNTLPGNHSDVKASARDYIANASLPGISGMMDTFNGGKLREQLAGHQIGISLLTVYFGFSSPLKVIGHRHYSTFVFDGSVKKQKDILKNNLSNFTIRNYTFVDYGQIDAQLAPEGKSVGAICTVDYASDWDGLNREEYNQKKQEVAEIFTDRLNTLIPGVVDLIEHIEVGTSKTVERYTLNPLGAVYGFAPNPNRIPISTIEGIDNLHIASAWGKFGGGFSGAIYSGYTTANDILRRK